MKRTVHCVVEPPATARGSDPGLHWRLRSQTEVIPHRQLLDPPLAEHEFENTARQKRSDYIR